MQPRLPRLLPRTPRRQQLEMDRYQFLAHGLRVIPVLAADEQRSTAQDLIFAQHDVVLVGGDGAFGTILSEREETSRQDERDSSRRSRLSSSSVPRHPTEIQQHAGCA